MWIKHETFYHFIHNIIKLILGEFGISERLNLGHLLKFKALDTLTGKDPLGQAFVFQNDDDTVKFNAEGKLQYVFEILAHPVFYFEIFAKLSCLF